MSHVLDPTESRRDARVGAFSAKAIHAAYRRWRTWLRQESPRLWLCLAAGLAVSLAVHGWVGRWNGGNDTPVAQPAALEQPSVTDPRWLALPAPRLNADLRALVEMAQSMGLTVERAQVRRTDAPLPLLVEEVEIELMAPYPLLRRFLARSLNEQPHLALKRLRLDRDASSTPGDPPVRSQLSLRLHYREGASP